MTGRDNVNNTDSLRRFCLTGIRGVGKTSLVQSIKRQNPEICFVSGSDILHSMMGETYDRFEYLPEKDKCHYRMKINERLFEIQFQYKKDLLVDSHLTVYNLKTKGIDVIFTRKDCEFYTDLILLDSIPERIYQRRLNDSKKKRIVDIETIVEELIFERETAFKVAKNYGMKLYIIKDDEKPKDKINKILSKNCEYMLK